jgi:hypothetical protein
VSSERPDRDQATEATGALRDHAPDRLTPPDERAPVSGHHVPERHGGSAAEEPEHDWSAARQRVYPLIFPAGTAGTPVDWLQDPHSLTGTASHTQPVVSQGPAGLVVVFAVAATGFDIIVNGEHLMSWGIAGSVLEDAARENLATWSKEAGWTDESSGPRRLLSSDTGEGYDAARILLPDVRGFLTSELHGDGVTPGTRILVGLPERHLLVAGALRSDDAEFVGLFRDFVVEHSGAAEEPIDRRIFELAEGELVEFRA